MKLIPINPPLTGGQAVRCCACASPIRIGGYADLAGVPFVDYYCEDCRIRIERKGKP